MDLIVLIESNLGFIGLVFGTITASVGGVVTYNKYWMERGREKGVERLQDEVLREEIKGIHECITALENRVDNTRKDLYSRYEHIHGEIKEVTGKVDTVIDLIKRNGN